MDQGIGMVSRPAENGEFPVAAFFENLLVLFLDLSAVLILGLEALAMALSAVKRSKPI